LSLGTGASGISVIGLAQDWMQGQDLPAREQVVLMDIRLPRLCMGILVGAALAVSGTLMQGLFRNPLADPGLVGVGAGASLGAVLAIVLGGALPAALASLLSHHLVAFSAFLGSWVATLTLYAVSSRQGRTSVATMLLAGIAFASLAMAATGLLIFVADDQQLRDLTFWGMGSLGGASWHKIAVAAPLILPILLLSPLLARGLNALALGEAAALHAGVAVEGLKALTILAVAAATGAAVAIAGGIGFIGIVVPHLLRLATGPDHRFLLPNAALLGASLLIGADIIARLVVAPAELPIGIITAILGAPVFLFILLRSRTLLDL
jgi:iron complex transport system permease protein